MKPWTYQSVEDKHRFYSVQHQVGEVIRIGALLAFPFMPVKATETLDILGVDPKKRNLSYAEWGKDPFYGRKGSKQTPQLFPRLASPADANNETMEELMKRRRAEKLAMKEELRQKRHKRVSDENRAVAEETAA